MKIDSKPYILYLARAGVGRIVATTSLTTTSDAVSRQGKARAATRTTKNIPILSRASHSASNFDELDAADLDTIRGLSSRAAVEIVLLDINTILADVGKRNVLISDVFDLIYGQFKLGDLIGACSLTVPVVPELDLMRHPFSLFTICESKNCTPLTTLLLLPPTDPILRP